MSLQQSVNAVRAIVPVMALVLHNELYLVVLPMIHMGTPYRPTEQVITLMPERNLATSFFPDEVESYISKVKDNTRLLTGGHVTGYDFHKEQTGDGRWIVRVMQHVQ
jgi:hypothetical protein